LRSPQRFAELPPRALRLLLLPLGIPTGTQRPDAGASDIREHWLRQSHFLHPNDFWLAVDLGTMLVERKKPLEAAGLFWTALGIRPSSVVAWSNLGNALHASKDLPGAIDAYKKALAIDNRYAGAWNNLGNALQDSKDPPGAIEAYEKALAIDNR